MTAVTVCHVSFYFCDDDQVQVTFMPLDTLYLAARLRSAGFDVDFRDYQVAAKAYPDPQDAGCFTASFLADASDVIVVTCTNEALPLALGGLTILKEAHPDKRVVLGGLGGAGAAGPPDEIIRCFPLVDYVVAVDLGPRKIENAEQTYVDLVTALQAGQPPATRVIHPAPRRGRRSAEDVTGEPLLPAYDLVDLRAYDEVVMRTAWGCPFLCSYCDRHRDRSVTWRSHDQVFTELAFLRANYRRKRVFFYDETFTLSKPRTTEFCDRLARDFPKVKWSCTSRADTIDDELAATMASAGCWLVFIGVESGSDNVLTRVRKGYDRRTAEHAVRLAQRHVAVNCFFIWGFPFESMADFGETVEFIERAMDSGVYTTLYTFSALPGSDACQPVSADLRFNETWWEANWPAHFPQSAGREELKELIRNHPTVFPGFYTADPLADEKLKAIKERGWLTHFPD